MATTAPKTAGRPRKTTSPTYAEASTNPIVSAPTPTIKVPVKEITRKDRVFRVVSGGGIAFSLRQSNITVYDSERNTIREIRYCPNEPSIWRDEQTQYAQREHIMFYDGTLFAPHTKPNLIAYLDIHPDNVANGGNVFAVVDNEKTAEEQLEREFEVLDAVNIVRDSDIQTLLPVAMFYNISVNAPTSEIRFNLLREARSNPRAFIESFDNPIVKTRSVLKTAEMYQIIKFRDSGAFWFDSGRLIISTPAGQDSLDVLARYCMTEAGAPFYGEIENRVSKL